MPPLTPKHFAILASVSIPLILLAAFLRSDTPHLASIASSSCYLLPEIDTKILGLATIESDITSASTTKASLILQIKQNDINLASTTLAIPKLEKNLKSDYAISLEKAKVDLLFAKYTAEKDIAAKSTAVKGTKPRTTAYNTAQARYTAAVTAYKTKFKSNPGAWPMTERGHRESLALYNTMLGKNNALKDYVAKLKLDVGTYQALTVSLPLDVEKESGKLTKLTGDLANLTLAIKTAEANICPVAETLCDNTTSDGKEIDDDRDGTANCGDTDCAYSRVCGYTPTVIEGSEICDNGIDDDENGLVDCGDGNCGGDPACNFDAGYFQNGGIITTPIGTGGGEICDNGNDDDEDSFADCADDECAEAKGCKQGTGEVCGDGEDNDGDQGVDCADTECSETEQCKNECQNGACDEKCGNKVDDNNNGEVDEGCCPDVDEDGKNDVTGKECQEKVKMCVVVSVAGVGSDNGFGTAVASLLNGGDYNASIKDFGNTNSPDTRGAEVEAYLKQEYGNDSDDSILVATHSMGAISVFNMTKSYGGSYSDTTFLYYDPPYDYAWTHPPLGMSCGLWPGGEQARAICRARKDEIKGASVVWTDGKAEPDAEHSPFSPVYGGSPSVLSGVKAWLDTNCKNEEE